MQLGERALEGCGALLRQLWPRLDPEQRAHWLAVLQEVLQKEKLPALKSQAGTMLAALP